MSENHADTRAILIWAACAAIRAKVMSGPELLGKAMSGSAVLLHLEFVMMSTVRVSTGDHRNHVCGNSGLS